MTVSRERLHAARMKMNGSIERCLNAKTSPHFILELLDHIDELERRIGLSASDDCSACRYERDHAVETLGNGKCEKHQ